MKYSQGDMYCYRESDVLINIAGIKDPEIFKKYEQEFSTIRMNSIEIGDFSVGHFKNIHKHIFQDIYSWAGEFRNCTLSKGTSLFAQPQYIEQEIGKIISRIQMVLSGDAYSYEQLIELLTYTIAEMNAIHPFREGNGRTIREFARQIAATMGYFFKISIIDPQEWILASIECFNDDNMRLQGILRKAIKSL